MRYLLVLFLFLSILTPLSLAAAELRQAPSALCPPMPSGAKVDAVLDEIVWLMPPVVPKFIDSNRQEPKEQTQAWAAYGKDGVWFAFSCDQATMATNRSTSKAVWEDDGVGVLLDAAGQRKGFRCFLLNAAGAKMHVKVDGQEVDWNAPGEWQAAVNLGEGKWTAEMFVPYDLLGVTLKEHSLLRANLGRNNAVLKEVTAWEPVNFVSPDPLRFGDLVMGIPDSSVKLSASAEPAPKRGSVVYRVRCDGQLEKDATLKAVLYPGGKSLKSEGTTSIPAGKSSEVLFVADSSPTGLVNLVVEAADPKTGVTISQASFAGEVSSTTPANGIGTTISRQPWGTLWSAISTSKVMRDTLPPDTKSTAISIAAAGNEYEAFQLVLRPTKQLTGVKVSPHTLVGPKGSKIEAWNIKVRNVEYVNVTEPTTAGIEAGQYPDPLPEFTAFTAKAGENSPIWVTIYVPPKTPAGDYTGTVDISASGLKKIVVPIKLHVYGFSLPSVSRLRTAYGCSLDGPAKFQGAATLEQKRKLVDLYNLDFFKHRIAPYTPYAFYPINGTVENGQVKLDYSEFDVAVKKYFPMFNSFNLPGFAMRDTAGMDFGDDYDRLKTEYMRAVTEHLVDLGQIEKGYNYITDEPTEEHYPAVVAEADLCRRADQRIKVLLTEQVEKPLIGSVDIWVPLISNYDEQKSKARQKAGEEIWWYVCCGPLRPYPNNFIDYTALEHRILPWITWRYGVNGILYWNTTYWRDNPYETPMSYTPDGSGKWGNGDGNLLYPPVKRPSDTFIDKGPVPSIRWEMIRDGMEDYDYIRLLEDKLARSKSKSGPAVEKARAALDVARDCGKSRTEFTRDPKRLESARRRVAEAIEGLK